ITGAGDPPRVLVLTTYDTDADILAAVEAGAAGYLLKDAPPEELLGAVRTAAAGRSALAPAVAVRLMDRMRSPGQTLSAREIDVLTHVAAGRSNQQIAHELFISEATVKSHLVHIFTKLDVESRAAATAKAAALGPLRRCGSPTAHRVAPLALGIRLCGKCPLYHCRFRGYHWGELIARELLLVPHRRLLQCAQH